jgi:hypothetical protein
VPPQPTPTSADGGSLIRMSTVDAELISFEVEHHKEQRAPAGDGAERGAARGPSGAGGNAAQGVDGVVRVEEDQEVLPHALLRPRQQAARVLQEQAQGQHGDSSASIQYTKIIK